MSKVPVTTSAVIQRAKRGFAAQGEALKIAREGSATHSLGPFYTVTMNTNVVDRSGLNMSDLAEMYLKPHEQIFEELVRQVPAAELPQVLADLQKIAASGNQVFS